MNAPDRSRPVSPAASLRGADGWQRADLRFAVASDGRARLARQFVQYPFHITRPVHLDAGWPELATLVMQSTSGGLYRDDRVALGVSVGRDAAAHVTTQSATKVHSMVDGGHAVQETTVSVESGGHLEFVSDALILFPKSRLESLLRLSVADGGSAIVTDSALWHDPAGDPDVTGPSFASLRQTLLVSNPDTGKPSVAERQWSGDESVAGLDAWRAWRVQGAVYVLSPGRDIGPQSDACRQALADCDGVWGGVTALPGGGGAAVRLLANDGAAMRAAMQAQWRAARYALTGRDDGLNWRK